MCMDFSARAVYSFSLPLGLFFFFFLVFVCEENVYLSTRCLSGSTTGIYLWVDMHA